MKTSISSKLIVILGVIGTVVGILSGLPAARDSVMEVLGLNSEQQDTETASKNSESDASSIQEDSRNSEVQPAIDLPEAVKVRLAQLENKLGCDQASLRVFGYEERIDQPSDLNGGLFFGNIKLSILPKQGPQIEIAAKGGGANADEARLAGRTDLISRLETLANQKPDC